MGANVSSRLVVTEKITGFSRPLPTNAQLVAFLGVLGLSALGLDLLPKWWRWGLILIFLIEMLPIQTASRPLTMEAIHPAHAWLMEQPLKEGHGVAAVHGGVLHGPEPLYISWQTKLPHAAAIGSFVPAQHRFLRDTASRLITQEPDQLARLFQSYQIQYLVIHRVEADGRATWEYLQEAPEHFNGIDCFDAPPDYQSPWASTLCVVEVLPHPTINNIYPIYGFSDTEPWGAWTIEDRPRLDFLATAPKPYTVTFDMFPHCIEGKQQAVQIIVAEQSLYQYEWEACENVTGQVIIPSELITQGRNELVLQIDYAISPTAAGTGNDPRQLAIGFSTLTVTPNQ